MSKLDKFTIGSTPASIYLVDVLNEIRSSKLNRKVLNIIKQFSDKINALERAHDAGVMNTHICASYANTLYQELDNDFWTPGWDIFTQDIVEYMIVNVHEYAIKQILVDNLLLNVLRGKYKSLIRRLTSINKIEKAQRRIKAETNFIVKDGTILATSKTILIKQSVMDQKESITAKTLADKSLTRFNRRNAKVPTV